MDEHVFEIGAADFHVLQHHATLAQRGEKLFDIARILRGTGHVNAGLGLVMTVQGIGAALSPAVAGAIATRYGFPAAFLTLGVFALVGLALWAAGRSFSGLRAEGVA